MDSVSVNTQTYYGIFKLVNLVHRVAVYAEQVYWPLICDKSIDPLIAAEA